MVNPDAVFFRYHRFHSPLDEICGDELPEDDSTTMISYFATALLQKTCQSLRNEIVMKEWSVYREVRMFIIEVGFIAASVLTPLETIARLVLGLVLFPFGESFSDPLFKGAFLGVILFPHAILSSFTHFIYRDRQIDFVGQGGMIFCQPPAEW